MVDMCDLFPCRKEFLHMASSPQAIHQNLLAVYRMNVTLCYFWWQYGDTGTS